MLYLKWHNLVNRPLLAWPSSIQAMSGPFTPFNRNVDEVAVMRAEAVQRKGINNALTVNVLAPGRAGYHRGITIGS